MKLIAHRGTGAKENTIDAFKNAIKSDKVIGFELDIRLSQDNDIVVIHDPFVDRVFDENGLVKYMTTLELQKLGVPKLVDVLNLPTDKIIMIEVKDININLSKLVDLLHSYPHKNIYLMSFHSEYINKVLKLNPKFKVGILHNIINREHSYNEYDFIGLYAEFATDNIVDYFKNRGIELFLFGLNEQTKKYQNYYKTYQNVYLIVDL